MNPPSTGNETRLSLPPPRAVRHFNLWLKAVTVLVFAGLTFLLTLLFLTTTQSFSLFDYILFIIGILLLFYLVIVVHEIGHIAAGKLVGFRFQYLTIGPLRIERKNRRLTFKRVSTRSMPVGMASSIPTDDHDLRRRMIIMIAGGSLANLLVALLAALVFLALPGGPHTLTALIFLSLCLLSTATFVLNLLATLTPSQSGEFPSDGRLILDLLKKRAYADRMCASISILNASRSGIRPRDWNTGLVQQVTRSPDDTLAYLGGVSIAYYHALDRNEIDEASRWLAQMIERLSCAPAAFHANYLLELAYFEALHRGDAISARLHFSEAKEGAQIDQATRACVEAAVLLAEGQPGTARAAALRGLALLDLDEATDLGAKEFERARLQDMADRTQCAQSNHETSPIRADQ